MMDKQKASAFRRRGTALWDTGTQGADEDGMDKKDTRGYGEQLGGKMNVVDEGHAEHGDNIPQEEGKKW